MGIDLGDLMFVLLGLITVATVFGMAACTRLIVIGYPHKHARGAMTGVSFAAAVVGVVVVRTGPDGIIDMSLRQAVLMGSVFIAANVLFLVVARTLPATGPPRRTSPSASSVKVEMPRRPTSKWLFPALLAGPGIFGFRLAQAGQWALLAVFAAMMMIVAFQCVMVDLNYRRQKSLADTDNGLVPVILLRSFASDHISGREFGIAKAVRKRYGRLIALGNPNDESLPFGADRHYLSYDGWQVELTNMARSSEVILMLPDVTPSIRWELTMIRQENLQTRFYVVQPHVHPIMFWKNVYRMLVGARNPLDWSGFAQVLREAGFQAVPETAPSIGFVIGFDSEGRCVEVGSGLRNATMLVERIHACLFNPVPPPVQSHPPPAL
jgi:hypothetical protein